MKRSSLLLRRALLLTALSTLGCDKTVALDTTLPSLRDVYVSGVCPAEGYDNQLDLSIVLLSQEKSASGSRNLLPDSRVQKERKNVGELLGTTDFEFSLPSIAMTEAGMINGVAYMTNDDDPSAISPLAIDPIDIQFEYVAGKEQQTASPYVIFVLDQSASHIGQTITEVKPEKATDYNGYRLSFFSQVISNLPENYYASIISYQGNFDDALKTDNPTNIPLSLNPSQRYEYEEEGTAKTSSGFDLLNDRINGFTSNVGLGIGTPMIQALKSALSIATEARDNPPNKNGLRPVVVLYTDGIEDGDTSGSSESISDIAAMYEAEGIPVNVVHLNLPFTFPEEARVRNSEFAELACRTRGDYLFLHNNDAFNLNQNLMPMITNRIDGRWKLTVQSTFNNANLFPGGQGYLFNTALRVTLGEDTRAYSVARPADGKLEKDNRIWIYKD